jgi:molybdopterin-guanine dinucleotide biosynthesis protein A
MVPERLLAAVLAGGAGRRIGGAKPSTLLGGMPLISYPVGAAAAAGLEVVVIAKRDSVLPSLDCTVIAEPDAPQHPLCGIVAALERADERDMPFLTAPLLAWLADRPAAAVVELDGQLQPLLARYVPADRPIFEQALSEQLSLTGAVRRIAAARITADALARFGDPTRLCFNVNDTAELALAEQWLAH